MSLGTGLVVGVKTKTNREVLHNRSLHRIHTNEYIQESVKTNMRGLPVHHVVLDEIINSVIVNHFTRMYCEMLCNYRVMLFIKDS